MILSASVVLTMEGAPIENGAVAIEGARIVDVGPLAEVRARRSGDVLDLGEQILLPGLINVHSHLDYTMLRGRIPPQPTFTDWIREINAAKARFRESDYLEAIVAGAAEARRFGTTSLVNLTAFPELLVRLPALRLRVWWCAELIDVRENVNVHSIVAAMRKPSADAAQLGLAPHAPFTASAGLYAECTMLADEQDLLLTTHVAESREEMQMFQHGRGALYDFLKGLGRKTEDCGGSTPLRVFLESAGMIGDHFEARWIVAHLNELTEEDFILLVRTPKFHIAHCPRSHRYFQHASFKHQRLRDLGYNLCLATDSLASNSDLSLFAEMRLLHALEPDVPTQTIVEMVTANPAKALGRVHDLGRIAPGYLADLIAIPFEGSGDWFGKVINFAGRVPWVMIGGHASLEEA